MIKKFSIFILLSIFGLSGFADPVDVATARNAAKNFYCSNSVIDNSKANINLAFTAKGKSLSKNAVDEPLYFVFNINQNDGYVIIAADDDVLPILSYSLKGHYINENLPPAYVEWMDKYTAEIQFVKSNHLKADKNIHEKWEDLISGEVLTSQKSSKSVNPLLTTTWGQSPYYNELCPFDNSQNKRTVTGCVATAMAQIMKFWNYPTKGTGSHSYIHSLYGTLSADFGNTTYNWSGMPNNVTSSNTSVATLMYHCGVSVDMNYGVNESGAYATECEFAYRNYFNYSMVVKTVVRLNYSDDEWKLILKSELDAGRPILYAAFNPNDGGGHAFVCDGYNSSDFMHFNWGWSGTNDGYYNINSLNPGSYNYNGGHYAIINISPTTPVGVPTVTTKVVSDVTWFGADCGGTVVADGGSSVTERGVCWSTSQNPDTSDYNTTDGSGTGSYSSSINFLTENTTYYVRAYAINSSGVSYGNQLSFTTVSAPCPATVTDIDGNTYNTVSIGSQCWTKENLKTTRLNNGNSIPVVTDNTSWSNLFSPAYCWYNNDYSTNGSIYGALYNWYVVEDDNLCPVGWHVPTHAEWTELKNYLGGDPYASVRLKEASGSFWPNYPGMADNSSGFTALPGGHRHYGVGSGAFDGIQGRAIFWSTDTADAYPAAYSSILYSAGTNFNIDDFWSKQDGFSVRCLKNKAPVNDNCTGAILIEQNISCSPTTATTKYATQSIPAISCSGMTGTADDDVWFKFTALTSNPTITITGDPNFDAVVELLSGACNGSSITCADASGYGGTETISASGLSIGSTYYIRVYGYSSSLSGTFTICVFGSALPASNDNWTSPISVSQAASCTPLYATTVGASASGIANECGGNDDDDVWFTFVALSSTPEIHVTGLGDFDPVLELLDQNKNNLTCSNYTGEGGEEVIYGITLNIGSTYYLRIYGYGINDAGTFSLCVRGSTTGMIEPDENEAIYIYPNPANETLFVTFNTKEKVNSIEIINTIGQTVFVKQITTMSKSEKLDISGLQQGVYFIKVQTDNGNFIKKIIKE